MLIYLMSDDIESLNQHPENVVSDFKINLAQKVELNGEWEVALVEAQIPYTWVEKKYFNMWLRYHTVVTIREREQPQQKFKDVELGDITNLNIDEVIQLINKLIKKDVNNRGAITFARNEDGRIKINIDNASVAKQEKHIIAYVSCVDFSENLAAILGFENKIVNVKDRVGDFIADFPPFMPHRLSGIAIYCNLIENQYVSSKFGRILRLLAVQDRDKSEVDTNTFIFTNPYFLPLRKTRFNMIHIQCHDLENQRIKFESGVVIVCLKLRPRLISSINN